VALRWHQVIDSSWYSKEESIWKIAMLFHASIYPVFFSLLLFITIKIGHSSSSFARFMPDPANSSLVQIPKKRRQ